MWWKQKSKDRMGVKEDCQILANNPGVMVSTVSCWSLCIFINFMLYLVYFYQCFWKWVWVYSRRGYSIRVEKAACMFSVPDISVFWPLCQISRFSVSPHQQSFTCCLISAAPLEWQVAPLSEILCEISFFLLNQRCRLISLPPSLPQRICTLPPSKKIFCHLACPVLCLLSL